jgi:hypothetical protein
MIRFNGTRNLKAYEGLARFMGAYSGLAIFRRFEALNLRNLMFSQAGVADLEQAYEQVVAEEGSCPETAKLSQAWTTVAKNDRTGEGPLSVRYELLIRLRKLLEQYSNS